MTKEEIKQFIAEKVSEGVDLSHIQSMLAEKGAKMTYMELRLLASEIADAQWTKLDKPEKKDLQSAVPAAEEKSVQEEHEEALPQEEELPEEEDASPAAPAAEEAPSQIPGNTKVELSKLVKPGAVANGSVIFGSGAKAEWYLDQFGRVGLANASGKPTKLDIQEFQTELQKLLGGM